MVAPEDRQVTPQSDISNPAFPKAIAKTGSPNRPKSAPQVKGVTKKASSSGNGGGAPGASQDSSVKAQEALLAEAVKILKGVWLKHPSVGRIEDPLQQYGIDRGWLISAVNSASDGNYALVDSGATNALRPAIHPKNLIRPDA